MTSHLLQQDQEYIWHPFTQQQLAAAPLVVARGQGAYLYTDEGQAILDGISSWWVNLHGHCHPHIVAAVTAQLQELEQVLFAGVTHAGAVRLAERLAPLLPGDVRRIFYSDNGSTAVEVAIKMALQYWANRGAPRRKLLAFRHSYHGDTFGAMAVSERGPFTAAFAPLLFEVHFVEPPLRGEDGQACLQSLREILNQQGDSLAAFIYEPLVQGAGGMRMQDPEVLASMLQLIKSHGILCIADEVMTGFGRTGTLFACDVIAVKPDIICLAKGLTGGTLPLSITACREEIYKAFLSEDRMKAFHHGHSFTANSLGCAAALASLDLLLAPSCREAIEMIGESHCRFVRKLESSQYEPLFTNIRVQGTILAMELVTSEASGYFNGLRDAMAAFFLEQGVLLRPLGNTLYVMPPYCVKEEDLSLIYEVIEKFADLVLADR